MLERKAQFGTLCLDVYKRSRDLAAKAKKILDDNGHDVTIKSLKEFYAKNGTILQCHKRVDYAYIYAHTLNNLYPASDAEVSFKFWLT